MATLYELTEQIANYEMQFDEDGVWVNEEELANLEMERDAKIENIGFWIKNLRADAKAIKEEEAALASRRKSKENKADRLEKFLARMLEGKPFSTARVAISFRRSESIEIEDEYAIDDKYCNLSVQRKPDKKVIKDAIKKGIEVVGARLIEKQNIQIK